MSERTDTDLLRWAIKNGACDSKKRQPRWAYAAWTLGLGSTSAIAPCRRLGLDPDEQAGGTERGVSVSATSTRETYQKVDDSTLKTVAEFRTRTISQRMALELIDLRRVVSELQEQIVEWKSAAGLNDASGDPDGIRPEHLAELLARQPPPYVSCEKCGAEGADCTEGRVSAGMERTCNSCGMHGCFEGHDHGVSGFRYRVFTETFDD